MFYRKSDLKKHKYFLKSIHGLWILPIIIINLIVPLLNFFIYKLNSSDMEIDIEKIIFFLLPVFSVWTSVFVSEMFFSDKTKDALFFYNTKKRLIISLDYFLLFLFDILAIVILHFYCINDYLGLFIKILSISIFYYGLSMIVLCFSKSAVITIMILLLYDLTNSFINSIKFFLLYENFDKMNVPVFFIYYLPLILIGILFIILVFEDIPRNSSIYR